MDTPARTGRLSPLGPWRLCLAAAAIALTALVAYYRSLDAPFLFDDQPAIVENQTIRSLRPIGEVLETAVPNGASVRGRPLVNLSIALNYAAGGLDVRGYHVFNLAVHVLAGLTLFGLVRRTLESDRCRAWPGGGLSRGRRRPEAAVTAPPDRVAGTAFLPALVVALLWTLHPLQSETVICSVLRTESLMGLLFLLTVLFVARGAASCCPGGWFAAAVVVCLLGMACKEVMVSAPLMVLLYDRTFISGSFREAWRRRRPLYLGLASTWVLLGFLVVHSGGQRGGTAGFGLGVSSWDYALTQSRAILLYLRLSVWPHPLVAEYGTALVTRPGSVAPQALVLLALLVGTAVALWRRPVLGFVGAWFFAILAPSSSVVPVATQTVAEHRMYLPLAAVIALGVAGCFRVCGRRGMLAFLVLAAAFTALTVRRCDAYRSEFGFWSDVLARQPDNPRAHYNLGCMLVHAGRAIEGIGHFEEALRLRPDFAEAHVNLGHALNRAGRVPEAIRHYEEALRLKPGDASAHYALGETFERIGRTADAIAQLRETLRLRPDFADAHSRLAGLLLASGRTDDAAAEYGQVLRLRTDDASARAGIERACAAQTAASAR